MNILNATPKQMQIDMDGHDTAYRFGFEDGQNAVDAFNGYTYFAGYNLRVYFEGHAAGLTQRHMLQNGQLAEPDEEAAMDADLETIRQQPKRSQEWYAVVEDELVGAEYSESPYLY